MGIVPRKWGLVTLVAIIATALFAVGIWFLFRPAPAPEDPGYQHKAPIDTTSRIRGNATAPIPGNATAPLADRPKQQDSDPPEIVRRLESGFVKSAARFVIEQYVPAGAVGGGQNSALALTFKAVNTHYGIDLKGVTYSSDSVRDGRDEILETVFQPHVFRAVHRVLGERFIQALVEHGLETEKRFDGPRQEPVQLNREEVGDMLQRLGQRVRQWGQVVGMFAENPALFDKVQRFQAAEQAVYRANFALDQVSARYERARQANATADLSGVSQELEQAGAAYKGAIAERESVRRNLIDTLHHGVPQERMRESELLYIAQWIQRRRADGLAGNTVLQSLGQTLRTYGEQLAKRGHELQRQASEIQGEEEDGGEY